MALGSDVEIRSAAANLIAGRAAGEVLTELYHRRDMATDAALDAVAAQLVIEQSSVVRLVDRLNLPSLPSAVILLAVLRHIRSDDAWIHHDLAKHLGLLCGEAAEAKLPAIIHALLALEGLKDAPGAGMLPLEVLTRQLAGFAPREAIRHSILAARSGDGSILPLAAPVCVALGLRAITQPPTAGQILRLAGELDLGIDSLPGVTSATGLGDVVGSPASVPASHGGQDSNDVNSDAWNWAAFGRTYHVDLARLRREWCGRWLHFDIDPAIAFDGRIKALRVEPTGGTGNQLYDIVNGCLIARAIGCPALEFAEIDGVQDALPITVDDMLIAPAGSSGDRGPTLAGSFFWPTGFEPLLQDYRTDFLCDTIERFARPVFRRFLEAADGRVGDDVVVLHFRGGDNFGARPPHAWYVQPPASFYLKAVEFALAELNVAKVLLVFQDRSNPCFDVVAAHLAEHGIPFATQSSSLFEDVATLLSARHLVAAFGTFCEAVALLSTRIQSYFAFRALVSQSQIAFWAEARVEDVLRARGLRLFVVDDPDRSYIPPLGWADSPEQHELMRSFPAEKLTILERTGDAAEPTR